MLRVQVNVKTSGKADTARLEMEVGAGETVASVKERLAIAQLIPFPDQDLLLEGEVLQDGVKISDCEFKDPASLDFVVKASDETLVKQLSELLQARDLSCDELGLLYCYKHGVSMGQALSLLGHESKLQEFIKRQKGFQLENNTVALVRDDTVLKPFSVAAEVEQILKATPSGCLDMKELCSRFMQKFNVSLSSITGTKPADFLAREKELFTVTPRGLISLRSMPQPKAPRPRGQAKPTQAWPEAAPPLMPPGLTEATAEPEVQGSCESQQYLELHNKICGRPFNSKIAQTLDSVIETVSGTSFLNIDHVVKGGSVGKGTAISGVANAEVILFVKGLPTAGHSQWLPPLLRAVAAGLVDSLSEDSTIEDVKVAEDAVELQTKGQVTVSLRLSPVFESYTQILQEMGQQGPEERRFSALGLSDRRTQFIAKQPSHVKVTIRLLKWWRDQQDWSTKLTRPSDDILELMAVYSAVQTRPSDQRQAIANVMSLCSRFNELRIVWSNFYTKKDVWAPLLTQRPLLMDPVNPFVNVAEPQAFDARELMTAAGRTHFFW